MSWALVRRERVGGGSAVRLVIVTGGSGYLRQVLVRKLQVGHWALTFRNACWEHQPRRWAARSCWSRRHPCLGNEKVFTLGVPPLRTRCPISIQ